MGSEDKDSSSTSDSDNAVRVEHQNVKEGKPVYYQQILVGLLLLAPFIMGIHINSLGNIEFVKFRIAQQLQILVVPEDWLIPGCLYPLGGLVGALTPGFFMEKKGAKFATYVYLVNVFLGAILKLISYWTHFALLWLGRFFEGIGSAGLMVSAIVLMFELITHLGAKYAKPLIQINVNFGILIIAFITIKEGAGIYYQWTFLIPIGLGLLLLWVNYSLPESPVYLTNEKRVKEADEALRRVHGENADIYIQELKQNAEQSGTQQSVGFKEIFTSPRYRGAILATIVLNAGQQLSGINCIIAFTPSILAIMQVSRPDLYTLIVLTSAFVGSVIFAPIVSLWRRKTLLIIAYICMAICLIAMLLTYHLNGPAPFSIFLFCFFVFIFQLAPGPLVWFICIEIFPKNAIKSAQTIGVTANWLSNSIVYGVGGRDINVMIFYAIINVLVTIYLIFFVSETLNRTSEEILDEYEQRFQVCSKC